MANLLGWALVSALIGIAVSFAVLGQVHIGFVVVCTVIGMVVNVVMNLLDRSGK